MLSFFICRIKKSRCWKYIGCRSIAERFYRSARRSRNGITKSQSLNCLGCSSTSRSNRCTALCYARKYFVKMFKILEKNEQKILNTLIDYWLIDYLLNLVHIFTLCFFFVYQWWQAHFFDPHFLRTQQFGDTGSDAHGDENSNNSSLNRRRDDDDEIDDDDDENDADSTNLPLNLVATQFAEWKQAKQRSWVQWMLCIIIISTKR